MGRGRWEAKKGGTIIPVYISHTHSKRSNCEGSHSVRLFLSVVHFLHTVADVHGVFVYTTRYPSLISNTWYTHVVHTFSTLVIIALILKQIKLRTTVGGSRLLYCHVIICLLMKVYRHSTCYCVYVRKAIDMF